MEAGDSVASVEYRADVADPDIRLILLNLPLQIRRDLLDQVRHIASASSAYSLFPCPERQVLVTQTHPDKAFIRVGCVIGNNQVNDN
jgi:hypothetical protein